MATSGEVVTYGEYEARTNRLAHLLRDQGLQRLDHYSIFMENNARYLEMCGAGERSGLYYTASTRTSRPTSSPTSSTTASRGCSSRHARSSTWPATSCPVPERRALARSSTAGRDDAPFEDYLTARLRLPATPRSPTSATARRCSTRRARPGRPKGILRQLPTSAPDEALPLMQFLHRAVALPGGHDVPLPRPAVPLGAAGRGRPHDPQRRHGDHHGALRPRAVPAARRAVRHHPQPARADDVQPDAQAARGRQARATTCRRWRPSSTPPRRARSRSRSR